MILSEERRNRCGRARSHNYSISSETREETERPSWMIRHRNLFKTIDTRRLPLADPFMRDHKKKQTGGREGKTEIYSAASQKSRKQEFESRPTSWPKVQSNLCSTQSCPTPSFLSRQTTAMNIYPADPFDLQFTDQNRTEFAPSSSNDLRTDLQQDQCWDRCLRNMTRGKTITFALGSADRITFRNQATQLKFTLRANDRDYTLHYSVQLQDGSLTIKGKMPKYRYFRAGCTQLNQPLFLEIFVEVFFLDNQQKRSVSTVIRAAAKPKNFPSYVPHHRFLIQLAMTSRVYILPSHRLNIMRATVFVLVAIFVAASAYPRGPAGRLLIDDDHAFQPPADGAYRSPCPALNILANHGYLPRDGKNITKSDLIYALFNGFNVGRDVGFLLANAAFEMYGYKESISLLDLQQHNVIEHDASLTRSDYSLGDSNAFNETLFDKLLFYANNLEYLTWRRMTIARYFRRQDSFNRNPHFTWNAKQRWAAAGETALFQLVFGDWEKGVDISLVKSIFRHERLPDGWKPHEGTILAVDVLAKQTIVRFSAWEMDEPTTNVLRRS
ncbi:hypothetical protein PROFUN_06640 [Planoprotostelium fungivorum]|uniref:Heme haloperoxidase family profile domain-containing protein n=1 Tax=Planoprotostelium fungivorum TaxID=1890364 RepID=A0A2P6MSU5_9EUKA|nr:hypothetical protein PROFUN_06640 [Planoprotostelium fungivorum]